MVDLAPLLVAIPLGAAFLCLFAKAAPRVVANGLAVASAGATLVLSLAFLLAGTQGVAAMGGWGVAENGKFVIGIVMVLDGLSRLFLALVAVVTGAVTIYGLGYLDRERATPYYHALFLLVVAGMNGVVLAGDLFNLFVFTEIAGIASYALVAWGTRAEELEASFKYLVLGSVASTAILIAIALLYSATGALNMADVSAAVAAGAVPAKPLALVTALFLAGFGLKAAMMPFHAWLPDAHPSAPAPISAMLSGLLIKTLGIYAMVRVLFLVTGVGPAVSGVLLGLGCLSMLGGVLLALGQDDLKRLLAYHSISQMGFVFVGLGTGTALGVMAGLFHAVNHALFKSALFLSSGSLERIAGTRKLSEMGGLARRAPATSTATVGAALSISGIPPFNGFWSKLLVIVALVAAGRTEVAFVAAAVAVMTLISFVKVQRKALFGELPARLASVRDAPAAMVVPLGALAGLCLLVGLLWPLGFDDVLREAARAVHVDGGSAALDYVRLVLGR